MKMEKSFEEIKSSEEYKEFRKHEKGAYLIHATLITEPGKKTSWEFGYYHPSRDTITTFTVNPVKRSGEEEAFKKEKTAINKLNMNTVKTTYEEALKQCEEHRKKNYPGDQIIKIIAILQNLHKQLWNITLITRSFSIINIKIDAKTSEILSASKSSIMDLGVKKF